MLRRILLGIVILAVVLATVFWPRAAGSGRYITYGAEIMASPISVTAPEADIDAVAAIVFEIFRDVDETMSEWKDTSPLSAVNDAAGREAVAVPDELRAVIRRGLELGARTDGAFDITWAALWGLWDFTAETPVVPDDEAIATRVALVDFRRVVVDDEAGTVFLPEAGMQIGLGGIAKGYALDRAAAALREGGFDSYMISAAGQMMLAGQRGHRPWRIGIRDPRGESTDDRNNYFAHVEITDVSLSTSGDYERTFVVDDVRYHHILDPRTGRPSRGVRSATVVSPDATLADALSTALMILGVERGLALAEEWDGVEAAFVDDEGAVHLTEGLRKHWVRRDEPKQ